MVKLSLCVTNEALCHEGVWGTALDPRFHDLATSCSKWSASRTCSFTPGESAPGTELDRRLSRPQSRSGRYGEVTILDPTGTRTRTPRSSSV
jgi:hypothetical protein